MKKCSKLLVALISLIILILLISSTLILKQYSKDDDAEIMGHEELKSIVKDRLEADEDVIDISNDPPEGWETDIIYNQTLDIGIPGEYHYGINATTQVLFQCPSVVEVTGPIPPDMIEYEETLRFVLSVYPKFNDTLTNMYLNFTEAVENDKQYANFELFYENDQITVIYYSYFTGNSLDNKYKS